MSWCDKLASRPTVGILFNKHFRPSTTLIEKLTPVLDGLAGNVSDKFSIAKQDTFGVALTTENGFHYTVDPTRVAVEFQHRLKLKPVSGAVPTVEMLSSAEPYTKMLQEVSSRALAAADLLIDSNRTLERIGIVCNTVVSEEDAPPGILRYIDHCRQPWAGRADHYTFNVVAVVDERDDWDDKCIMVFNKPESDDEELLTITFDYQRKFKEKKHFKDVQALKPIITAVQNEALAYFELLAIGDMFDEPHDDQ